MSDAMGEQRWMDRGDLDRALGRMSHELAEELHDVENLALVGIHTGGVPLARALSERLEGLLGRPVPVGEIDITLYRDDLYTGLEKPVLGQTRLPFSVTGATVVLVDDVLFTGRTVRAALDELMDFGRPARIRLAVMVDRGHRELPIAAGVVGRRIRTRLTDRVVVRYDPAGDEVDDGVFTAAREGDA